MKKLIHRIKYFFGDTNKSTKYTGRHPSAEQIITVADRLQRYAKAYPKAKLNMGIGTVNTWNYKCGTVHCHAGNYMVQCMTEDVKLDGIYTWINGADIMAEHLGFKDKRELKKWAAMNPKIWGNKYGCNMFSYPDAFNSPIRTNGAENNQHIVDHWREVAARMY